MTEFDDYDPAALEDKWDAQREDDCIEDRLRREGKVCMACGDPLHYPREQRRGCCRGDQCRNAALDLLRAEVERLRSEAEHDRETLTPIENAFEAVGGDLVDEVMQLRARVDRLRGTCREAAQRLRSLSRQPNHGPKSLLDHVADLERDALTQGEMVDGGDGHGSCRICGAEQEGYACLHPKKLRLVKLPPELYDGQHSTFVDADARGMELLGQHLADWLTGAEPTHGDTLKLELVEMTQEEFDAIPEC